jgi:transposase InsO family protein
MCAVLEISRKTYYKYRNADDPDYLDYLMIKKVFDDSKGTYGYRRITEGLKIEYGVIYNHKKIARIMLKYNIKPEYIKRIGHISVYRRIEDNVRPNLLKRNFKTDSLNKIWDTDITYLIYNGKRL